MQAHVRVRDVGAGRVRVECASAAASCGACAGRGGCALRWFDTGDATVMDLAARVAGNPSLRPGDDLVVEVDDSDLLRSAALAYLTPLAGLLAGAALAVALAPGHEPATVAGAALGLAAGWGLARVGLRRHPPRYRLRAAEHP